MKSEKAKEFLRTKQPGDIAQYEISRWKADRAVEIAEQELFENTACGTYWQTIYKPGHIIALCSECSFGKWHGKFKKVKYKDFSIEELKNMGILNLDKFIKLKTK